jgi:hypothetical protein
MGAEVEFRRSMEAQMNKKAGDTIRPSGASREEVKDRPAPVLFPDCSERPILELLYQLSISLSNYKGHQHLSTTFFNFFSLFLTFLWFRFAKIYEKTLLQMVT